MLFISNIALSQSYKKDSLQIKSYTEIVYKDSLAVSIKLKKVFCDYCNSKQLKIIERNSVITSEYSKDWFAAGDGVMNCLCTIKLLRLINAPKINQTAMVLKLAEVFFR